MFAHSGASSVAGDAVIVFVAALWVLGSVRIITGRPGVRRVVGIPRMAAGLGAFVLLAVVLSPPLDNAADAALWVHMIQHLCIGLVAPALLCLARPALVLSSVLDPPVRRRVERRIGRYRRRWGLRSNVLGWALAVTACHVVVWWTWHVPMIFDIALRHDSVHAAEHACLFAAGMLLWWVCLGVHWDDRGAVALFVLFGAAVGTGMIGALITIAPRPEYATSAITLQRWGLTRLSDQQLGGVIMWVGGGSIYLAAGAAIAWRWLLSGPASGEETLASP